MLQQLLESMFFRMVLAGVLGALIGIERDIHSRAAGFRTHMFVSMGAALFTIVSFQFSTQTGFNCDAARIAAQIVSGIGFLGAGAILRNGATIKGLTTAVCVWVAAAIGMSVAIGMFFLAISSTMLVLIILILFKKLEWLFSHKYHICFEFETDSLETLHKVHEFVLQLKKFNLSDFSYKINNSQYSAKMDLTLFSQKKRAEIVLAFADMIKPVNGEMRGCSVTLNQEA